MKTFDEILQQFDSILDRPLLEEYIAHQWVQPLKAQETWYFEAIDIARVHLVYQLHQILSLDKDAMDIVLSLLDQLYHARQQRQTLIEAIQHQPLAIQTAITTYLSNNDNTINHP